VSNLACSALLALTIASFGGSAHSQEVADRIFIGGTILTMDDEKMTAEALAVKDGRIVAVGDLNSVLAHKGGGTVTTDLEGKALLPGFLDAHSHYINSLLVAGQAKLYAPPVGPGENVDSIVATLKTFATENNVPEGEMITAYGYDDTVMPDRRLLNRDDLDAAFPNNPVRVDHVSMHGAVLNSAALEMFNIDETTVTPPGGVIVRKEGTNEPYGLIMETAFLSIIAATPTMSPEAELIATKAGQMLYAEAGVTTAHEGATHLEQIKTINRATDAGANIIDVIAYPFITDVDAILDEFPLETWGQYRDGFKIGGVKVTIDGSPQGRTAKFSTPYLTGGPSGEENWTGELTFPQEMVNDMVAKVYEMGVPLNLHANGDGAIDAFFEAHETVAADDLNKDRDVTMIHAQFTRPDQIAKFVDYKIRPSFYTLHTYYFADAHIANRGATQTAYISPMRDAIDAGLRPTNHTDFVVAPLDQMFMLWSAVNRVSRSGEVIGEDQRVTPLEGLKAMTIWAAEQYGEDGNKGSLASGKLADLIVLSADPTAVDPMAIRDIVIVETIKEGTTIYTSE
jgi:predicted amidohydrolase YtcJ